MNTKEYDQKKQECWAAFKKQSECEGGCLMADAFFHAFDRAYTLGKQEKDADTVISGWVARDEDGSLHLFTEIPTLDFGALTEDRWWYSESSFKIDSNLYPDLRWFDEPQEVELIIIKRKKNG